MLKTPPFYSYLSPQAKAAARGRGQAARRKAHARLTATFNAPVPPLKTREDAIWAVCDAEVVLRGFIGKGNEIKQAKKAVAARKKKKARKLASK